MLNQLPCPRVILKLAFGGGLFFDHVTALGLNFVGDNLTNIT